MHDIDIAVKGVVDVSGTGHLKLGSMISAAIEAWEGGGVLNLGRLSKTTAVSCMAEVLLLGGLLICLE